MSIEDNKEIARKFIEAVNQQNYAAFGEFMAPELAKSTKQRIQSGYVKWEGHHVEIIETIAERDKVYMQCVNSAKHTGEVEGIPPTGKHMSTKVVFIFRIDNGKITEWDGLSNVLDIVKQLGATVTRPQG